MKVMLKEKNNIVVSIEIDGDDALGLRAALAKGRSPPMTSSYSACWRTLSLS